MQKTNHREDQSFVCKIKNRKLIKIYVALAEETTVEKEEKVNSPRTNRNNQSCVSGVKNKVETREEVK